jgi:hypothetical protein
MDDDDYQPIGSAFDIGRSISNGFAAVRVAAGPLWLGGLLIWISESCSGPGGLPGDLAELADDGDSNALWRAPSDWVAQRAAVSMQGMGDTDWIAWLIGAALVFLLFGLVVGLLLFALYSWLQPGFLRLHASVLEHASDSTAGRATPVARHSSECGVDFQEDQGRRRRSARRPVWIERLPRW